MAFKIRVTAPTTLLALLLACFAGAANLPQSVGGTPSAAAEPKTAPSADEKSSQSASAEPSVADLEEKSWQILQLGLRKKKVAERVEAVKALSLLAGNRQAVRFALRAMRDKNPQVRAAAASTLGDLHATTTVPALRAALSDKNASVMLAAAHALYILKDPLAYEIYYAILMGDKKTSQGVIQAQIERLKDPKQVAQMGIQEGIGFVPYAGMGYEAYRQLMKHDNSPVRAAAARFLALDPDPISVDALVQVAVTDKNVIVREAALDALAQREDSKCIQRLASNLDEDKYPVRYRTAAAIIHLGSAEHRKADLK